MRKIVTILQPFDMAQNVFVYEDGQKIAAEAIPTPEIDAGICALCNQYEITEINFGGPKQYARGISKKISELAATQYGINDLQFVYL